MTDVSKLNGTIRVRKRQRYTTLDNEMLRDKRLSFGARGLLAYLLSRPNNWKTTVPDLIKQSPSGRDAIYTMMRELTRHGYIRQKRIRRDNGTFSYETCIYECPEEADFDRKIAGDTAPGPSNINTSDTVQPLTAFPDTVEPETAEPDTVDPLTDKPEDKEVLKYEVLNEERTIKESGFTYVNPPVVETNFSHDEFSEEEFSAAPTPPPSVPSAQSADSARSAGPKSAAAEKPAASKIEFRIYEAYPRKVGRPQALESIRKAIKNIATGREEFRPSVLQDGEVWPPEDAGRWLLARVKFYAECRVGGDPTKTPHPSTWFNQGRYTDNPDDWIAYTASQKPTEKCHDTNQPRFQSRLEKHTAALKRGLQRSAAARSRTVAAGSAATA